MVVFCTYLQADYERYYSLMAEYFFPHEECLTDEIPDQTLLEYFEEQKSDCCIIADNIDQAIQSLETVTTKNVVMARFLNWQSVLNDSTLKETLSESLMDEVVYSYLMVIVRRITKRKIHVTAPCGIISEMLFPEDTEMLKPHPLSELMDLDLLVSCTVFNNHWTLVVAHPKAATIIFFNPLGEIQIELQQQKVKWNKYLSKRYGLKDTWDVITLPHPKQQDSVSCGVLCLKFAECLLMEEQIPQTLTNADLCTYRKNIVRVLLSNGGERGWCKKLCRLCGKKESDKSKGLKIERWIQCDLCDPVRWFHEKCLGVEVQSNKPFNCSSLPEKRIEYIQDWDEVIEVSELKRKREKEDFGDKKKVKKNEPEGTCVVRKRTTRIKVCGGCRGGFKEIMLPPYDLCLKRREKRFQKGEKAPDGKQYLTWVHYHLDKGCMRGVHNRTCELEAGLNLLSLHKKVIDDLEIQFV